ncbi:SOS response-associated peptidase [Streptomyces sp. NPDC051940]|uniref:SOS response-associated peptidase n=1 Tax=Streptomyces sp. NPDC051940 TaxID=3155675 RepID=UPI0034144BD6
MCGRYASSRKPEDLVTIFDVEKWDPTEAIEPDYNVAPTKDVYAVLERPVKDSGDPRPVRQLRTLRWGLVPSWAKSPDTGVKMINARAETVMDKPAYRRAFASRRCLLPADGYFEWITAKGELKLEQEGKKKRPRKQPFFITPRDGSVFAMAGLFEFWRDKTLGDDDPRAWWVTCTVLTTEAESTPLPDGPAYEGGPASLHDIHPRMPLMLPPDRWDTWLDPANADLEELVGLLAPPPAGLLKAYPVSTAVSNVRNSGAELVQEIEAPEEETLF